MVIVASGCEAGQKKALALSRLARYAFRFMHEANLGEGPMWPTAFALKELTAAEVARIAALVKQAVR